MIIRNISRISFLVVSYSILNGCSRYYIQNQTRQEQVLSIKYPISKQAEKNMKRFERFERYGLISDLGKNIAENKSTVLSFSLLPQKRILLSPSLARLTLDTSLFPVVCYPKGIKNKQNIIVCLTPDRLSLNYKEKFTPMTLFFHSTRIIYIE